MKGCSFVRKSTVAALSVAVLLGGLVTAAPTAAVASTTPSPPPANVVIDGVDGSTEPNGVKVYTLTDVNGIVIIRNSKNIVIRGANKAAPYSCRIAPNNPNASAITLYNVQNVTIERCEVRNAKQAIWADIQRNGVSASSSDITVRNNYMHNFTADAMQFKRYPGEFQYDFHRVRILDNHIAGWGQGNKDDYLFHGIYMKAGDALIEGNYFSDGWGGDAITIRSAGTVRNNIINDVNDVGGISYYAQVDSRGTSGNLVIENNIVYTRATTDTARTKVATATMNLGGIGGDPNASFDYLVPNTVVRFNTLAVLGPDGSNVTKTLYVDPGMAAQGKTNTVEVYGNLYVDTRTTPNFTYGSEFADYYQFNLERATTDGLVTDSQDPRRQFRLTAAATDVIDQIRSVELGQHRIVRRDIDADRRAARDRALLDYGADEYVY